MKKENYEVVKVLLGKLDAINHQKLLTEIILKELAEDYAAGRTPSLMVGSSNNRIHIGPGIYISPLDTIQFILDGIDSEINMVDDELSKM